jgi:hypothetical protein
MTINDIDEKNISEVEEKEIPQPDVLSTGIQTDQELADMFEIEKADYGRLSPKINTLLEYAKANTNDQDDVRWVLRRLETKLGAPPMGVDKISHMAEYAFLWLQERDINKKLDNYGSRI